MTRQRGVIALLVATSGVATAQPVDPERPKDPTETDTTLGIPDTEPPQPLPSPPTREEETTTEVDAQGDPTYMTNRTYRTTTTEERGFMSKYGFALSAGGGVSGFTSETARNATDAGGGWDVRATVGTRLPVGAEISYLGSAQTINALGLDGNAVLVGNGLQANIRLNVTSDTTLQPFIFAGAAWRRYDLANTDTNTSDVSDSDDVVEFPVGVGFAYRVRGVIVDARGEFRAATNEDLMPSLTSSGALANDNQASLHRWGVTANVGYEF